MKKPLILAAPVAALLAAGCASSGTPAPQATVTVTAPPAAASSPAARSAANSAAVHANARALVDALASGSSDQMRQAAKAVSGTVMRNYVKLQDIADEAGEATGQPSTAEQVTVAGPGSFQLCYPQDSGGGCQTFSNFLSGKSGRITGMSVDGVPVKGRLAIAPDASGGGVSITDVASYRSTDSGNIYVSFRLKNISSHDVAADGFTLTYVTSAGSRLQADYQASTTNISDQLPEGQSVAIAVAFDTRDVAGTFTVTSVFSNSLVSADLKVAS